MKTFELYTQVVHKAYASEPMVVIPNPPYHTVEAGQVTVRRAVNTAKGGVQFQIEVYWTDELETPLESIDREAELFKAMNAKRDEINGKQPGPVGIQHLN